MATTRRSRWSAMSRLEPFGLRAIGGRRPPSPSSGRGPDRRRRSGPRRSDRDEDALAGLVVGRPGGVVARSTVSTWSRLRKWRWLLQVSAPGSRPASHSTWKPLRGRGRGPASRSTTSCIGGAGGDRAGAEVVAVGEATGEDDGVDVLEVVVGVPQRDQFTPASRTAQAASTSSREPGKVRTPMRKRMRPFSRS